MASRHSQIITCPNCAASGDVTFVKHAPLKAGTDVETYYTARSSDAFTVTTIHKKPKWRGTITCNTCRSSVRDDTQELT
jgi:hypothetical protein